MTLTAKNLEERQAGLGGSDALAYCGKDPRLTPLELYLQKTGEDPHPRDADVDEPRKRWGQRLEPVVRDWLAEELGRKIFTSNRTYRSTEYPFMVGHLDGMVQSPMEGVEIKTADKFQQADFGEVDTDQVPIRYVLQCTHYMVVTRLRRFHLGALVGGNDARHYVIDWDQELADMLVDRARAFWKHVETKQPPDPVTLADTDLRWPQSHGRVVIANESIVHAIDQLKELRGAEGEACKKADDIEVMLKAFMGDAAGLSDAHHNVLATWRTQSANRFNVSEFVAAYPDLAAQFRKISEYRVFRLK